MGLIMKKINRKRFRFTENVFDLDNLVYLQGKTTNNYL